MIPGELFTLAGKPWRVVEERALLTDPVPQGKVEENGVVRTFPMPYVMVLARPVK